jgi:hypothetical protein
MIEKLGRRRNRKEKGLITGIFDDIGRLCCIGDIVDQPSTGG